MKQLTPQGVLAHLREACPGNPQVLPAVLLCWPQMLERDTGQKPKTSGLVYKNELSQFTLTISRI